MTAPAIVIMVLWAGMIDGINIEDTMHLPAFIVLTLILLYGLSMFCADWISYVFAVHTTLEIDMQTNMFTYRHKKKTITFKPTDVAHWYIDIGFWLSRVATHHTVIVLKSGEEVFIPMWLFEGNRFVMTRNPSENTFNASYFILSVRERMGFPKPEEGPRYNYILPN